MPNNREDVNIAIDMERNYQDKIWGPLGTHHHYSLPEWIIIIEEKLRKAKKSWINGDGDTVVKAEIIQVVTAGMSSLEQHGAVVRVQGGEHELWAEIKKSNQPVPSQE